MLISGAEGVLHIDGPRLGSRPLGTSKVKEIHRRGCKNQLFTLFSPKALFDVFSVARVAIWGAFVASFYGRKIGVKKEANRGGQTCPHTDARTTDARTTDDGRTEIKQSEL